MRQMLPQQTQMAIKSRQTVKVLRNITQIKGKRNLTTIKIKIWLENKVRNPMIQINGKKPEKKEKNPIITIKINPKNLVKNPNLNI